MPTISESLIEAPLDDNCPLKLPPPSHQARRHELHWNPDIPRHGLGSNLRSVCGYTILVSNLSRSVDFYCNVMKLELRSYEEGLSAVVDAKNMLLELKVGKPVIYTADHLIVGHLSIDVADSNAAFEYLKQKKVLFKVNVSVPKGVGKAESEGGSANNTIGQAFFRDPDGHYLEVCNCHLLTDFVLGLTDEQLLAGYEEGSKALLPTITACAKLKVRANRSKQNLKLLAHQDQAAPVATEPSKSSKAKLSTDLPPDPVIVCNFLQRRKVYGDICQSFSPDEIRDIVRDAGNSAPAAVLLMKQKVRSGLVPKTYRPPAFYIGHGDHSYHSDSYRPAAMVAQQGQTNVMCHKPTTHNDPTNHDLAMVQQIDEAIIRAVSRKPIVQEEKKEEEYQEEKKEEEHQELPFQISSANHIALIVSDVGKSCDFYTNVLGLQQVKRPDFDRHGAWFTGGNMEIHLILGMPLAPDRCTQGIQANVTWLVVNNFEVAKMTLTSIADEYEDDIQLELLKDVHGNEFALCRDPDGYVFGIRSE